MIVEDLVFDDDLDDDPDTEEDFVFVIVVVCVTDSDEVDVSEGAAELLVVLLAELLAEVETLVVEESEAVADSVDDVLEVAVAVGVGGPRVEVPVAV